MNKLFVSNKKKRKITINFNSKASTILCDFFESISTIKTKIINSFPELNSSDFNILYNNNIVPLDYTIQMNYFGKQNSEINFDIQIINKKNSQNKSENSNNNNNNNKNINNKISCQTCDNNNNNNNNNNNLIKFFCRNCLRFSCLNCKSFFHKNHNLIEIDNNNLEECVKIYSIQIQADLTHELNKYKEIQNKFKCSMLIDISSWKEIVIRKLNEIENVYLKFEKFAEIFEKKINEIEKNVIGINKNIDKNLNDLSWNLLNKNNNNNNNNIKKFDIENAVDYFNILKENEKFIKNLKKEINIRNEEFICSKKINDCFEKIEKIFDDLENFGNEGFSIIEKNINQKNINQKNINNELKIFHKKIKSENNNNFLNRNQNKNNKNNKNFYSQNENAKTPYNNYKSIKIMNNNNNNYYYNFTEENLNKKYFSKNKNVASMDNENFLNYIKNFNNNNKNNLINLPNIKKYQSNKEINFYEF